MLGWESIARSIGGGPTYWYKMDEPVGNGFVVDHMDPLADPDGDPVVRGDRSLNVSLGTLGQTKLIPTGIGNAILLDQANSSLLEATSNGARPNFVHETGKFGLVFNFSISDTSSTRRVLALTASADADLGWSAVLEDSLRLRFQIGNGESASPILFAHTAQNQFLASTWYQVFITGDEERVRFYINGSEVAIIEDSTSSALFDAADLRSGNSANGLSVYGFPTVGLRGTGDDFVIYSQTIGGSTIEEVFEFSSTFQESQEKRRIGRGPLAVVEIDLDRCQHTYSTSPCNGGRVFGPQLTTIGGNGTTTVDLSNSLSDQDDFYIGYDLDIVGGVGAPQTREIVDYRGSDRRATVSPAFSPAISTGGGSSYEVRDRRNPLACYNTRKTCQDPDNFTLDADPQLHRFSEKRGNLPSNLAMIPCVQKVDIAPSRITPGKGLGARASVRINLKDFGHSDIGIDPYRSNRTHDTKQGTYFGKLIARTPFYYGRPIRVRTGFVTDPWDWANFTDHHYIIEKIDGPSSDGDVTIIGRDVLKDLDGSAAGFTKSNSSRALCPEPTDIPLVTPPSGTAGNSFTVLSGSIPDDSWIRINDEIMLVTDVTVASPNDTIIVTRAHTSWGTVAATHSAGDNVQICQAWEDVNCIDIAYQLIDEFSPIDASSRITLADWNAVRDQWFNGHTLTNIISEPTDTGALLAQLSIQCLFFIWWDEIDARILLKAVAPPQQSLATIKDRENIVDGSMRVVERDKDRISRVFVVYDKRNYAESDDVANYQRVKVTVDAEAESAEQYGSPRTQVFVSNWFDENNDGQAIQLGGRTLNKLKDSPREARFILDVKDCNLRTGDDFQVETRLILDQFGAPKPTQMQVLEVRRLGDGDKYEYVAESTAFTASAGRFANIAEDTQVDYDVASDQDKIDYAFIAQNDGLFPDGTAAYRII